MTIERSLTSFKECYEKNSVKNKLIIFNLISYYNYTFFTETLQPKIIKLSQR